MSTTNTYLIMSILVRVGHKRHHVCLVAVLRGGAYVVLTLHFHGDHERRQTEFRFLVAVDADVGGRRDLVPPAEQTHALGFGLERFLLTHPIVQCRLGNRKQQNGRVKSVVLILVVFIVTTTTNFFYLLIVLYFVAQILHCKAILGQG